MKGAIVLLDDGSPAVQKRGRDSDGAKVYEGDTVPVEVGDEIVIGKEVFKVCPHPMTGSPSIAPLQTALGVAWQPVKLFAGRVVTLNKQSQGGVARGPSRSTKSRS